MLFANFVQPLRELHRIIDEAHESSLRVADLVQMLSLPKDPHILAAGHSMVPVALGSGPVVELRSVSFCYPQGKGEPCTALRDVNVVVNEGEKLGLAGASGSGKSTLIKVLLGLIHANSGTVLVRNTRLDQMSRPQIASHFAYMSQNPFLFGGTIEENLRYGCGDCTTDQIVAAARLANIHDEIVDVLGGYGGPVAERGRNLSGGQQQRIAIARVFLKRAPILLLDEATSALDAHNETLVNQALDHAMAGRTVIAVAHRLSTLANMDRIVVLDKGRVIEEGTISSLLSCHGVLYHLNEALFSQIQNDRFLHAM